MREQHAEQMIGTPLLQQVRHRPVETQRDARRVGRARSVGEREWHERDRKSTRLNSSHLVISYAVFCLKKKKKSEGMVYISICKGSTFTHYLPRIIRYERPMKFERYFQYALARQRYSGVLAEAHSGLP